jgi:hypothetical protein
MAQAVTKRLSDTELMTAAQRREVQEFQKAARAFTKKVTRSRRAALQSLIDAGIFTPNGNPRKKYR